MPKAVLYFVIARAEEGCGIVMISLFAHGQETKRGRVVDEKSAIDAVLPRDNEDEQQWTFVAFALVKDMTETEENAADALRKLGIPEEDVRENVDVLLQHLGTNISFTWRSN